MLVLLAASPGTASAQSNHRCRPATASDSTVQIIRREAIRILTDTDEGTQSLRTQIGIPSGSISDVSIVQDDSTCIAAMAAFEAFTGKRFPEAFVLVRLGQSAPFFYLMTPARENVVSTIYVLNGQFALVMMLGTEG